MCVHRLMGMMFVPDSTSTWFFAKLVIKLHVVHRLLGMML
jgi:hypothetical protein